MAYDFMSKEEKKKVVSFFCCKLIHCDFPIQLQGIKGAPGTDWTVFLSRRQPPRPARAQLQVQRIS